MRQLFLLFLACFSASATAQNLTNEHLVAGTKLRLAKKIEKLNRLLSATDAEQLALTANKPELALPRQKTAAEDLLTGRSQAESEITAVIHPTDSNRMAIAVMYDVDGFLVSEIRIGIHYTTDGGDTWETGDLDINADNGILSPQVGGGDPVLAYDDKDRLHLLWLELVLVVGDTLPLSSRIYHTFSLDDGATWPSPPEIVSEGAAVGTSTFDLAGTILDKGWLVADRFPDSPFRGNLYAFYTEIEQPGVNGVAYRIKFNRWNEADGWSPTTVAVPTAVLPFVHFASPVVSPDGHLHLMVAGATVEDEFTAFYFLHSEDGGETFSDTARITYWDLPCFLPLTAAEPPCVVGISASRAMPAGSLHHNPVTDELYAIWYADGFRDSLTEGVDIYFTRSADRGTTWSTPTIVNDTTDSSVDNFLPAGYVDDRGNFHVNWYDQRSGETEYYGIAYFSESGAFGDEYLLSTAGTDFSTVGSQNAGFGVGEYNATVASCGELRSFWADGRSNDGNLDVYLGRTAIAGESCQPVSVQTLHQLPFNFRILANPAGETLTVDLTASAPISRLSVEIIDATGRRIAHYPNQSLLAPGTHLLRFPLSSLSAGSYFVSLGIPSGGKITRRFVHR